MKNKESNTFLKRFFIQLKKNQMFDKTFRENFPQQEIVKMKIISGNSSGNKGFNNQEVYIKKSLKEDFGLIKFNDLKVEYVNGTVRKILEFHIFTV